MGSFRSGRKHNVIPDDAHLQLTVRSYEDEVRDRLVSEIKRIAQGIAQAHGATHPPKITFRDPYTPAGYHDPALSERILGVFKRLLGPENAIEGTPMMGGEDFSRFARHWKVPGLQFRVGAARPGHDPEVGLHSSKWAADPEPTVRTGTLTFARAVLELLPPKR